MTTIAKRFTTSAALLLAVGIAACSGPGSHQERMGECATLRQQTQQGVPPTAEQQRIASNCAHMDHSMGGQSGRR